MLKSSIELLIIVLSVYRVTLLFVVEDGPFYMFAKFRKYSGLLYVEELEATVRTNQNILSGILECFYCCSMWVAAILYLISFIPYNMVLLTPLAISGAAIIFYSFSER